MAYRRTTARRTSRSGSRRVSGNSRVSARRPVRARRASTSRRNTGGGSRTIRLVIEQAAPSVGAVVNDEGRFAVPDTARAKRAKF